MAPALILQPDTPPQPAKSIDTKIAGQNTNREAIKYEPGRTQKQEYKEYPYEDLKPSFPNVKWPPLEEVTFEDKGIKGDPEFKNLLRDSSTEIFDYTPKIGTEIRGLRLNELDDSQKDDLARLIATRGCVFFRDQEDFSVEDQREFVKYWGPLHKHATTGVPQRPGLEDVHVVYSAEDGGDFRAVFTPTFLWHSDVRWSPNKGICPLTCLDHL